MYCSKAKVSCKKPTAKKPTYKKAAPKKAEDHPHPEDHHGAGHTRKLQSADQDAEFEVRRPLQCYYAGPAEPSASPYSLLMIRSISS